MFRVKIISLLVLAFAILLSSCAPGEEPVLPPDATLLPEVDFPQQVETLVADGLTQTATASTPPPATPGSGETIPSDAVVATAPPPIVVYSNPVVGYRLELPGDWHIDESDMTIGLNQEVTFSPPNPEPFIAYLSINLDFRALDQIINLYAQSMPDATREDVFFNGYPGIKYTYAYQDYVYRIEYYIPYGSRILLIATDRPNDGIVQSILMTFRFTAAPQPVTYEATMADNGRTFVMNVGDKLRLNLDLNYNWSAISISNPAAIVGAQDGYFAFAGGTATLTATGNPGCLSATPPCGMPSIMFTITVIVP